MRNFARPYREEDVPNPLNVYGRTKLAGEEAIRASEVSHVILRTGWVYGVRRKNFLLTVLQKAADQDQLQFVDDQHGSPTWSRTVAEATSQSLIQGWSHDLDGRWWEQRFGTYHLTSIGETTWFGFAQSIVETWPLTKRPAVFPICSREWPSAAARPHRGVLSCDKWINTFSDLPTWEDALEVCKREHIKYES
jgi:dTDP-4-dehydrorhamnose reductase